MKTAIQCALAMSLLAGAAYADEAETIAASVPVEVSEVVSGGTWSEKGATGVYRAMVVSPSSAPGHANVIVQMLAFEQPDATPKVMKTVLIKEVAEKKLANAFLAMDAETENEMTLIITAYGAESEQDTSLRAKFDAKGAYLLLPGLAEEVPALDAKDQKN